MIMILYKFSFISNLTHERKYMENDFFSFSHHFFLFPHYPIKPKDESKKEIKKKNGLSLDKLGTQTGPTQSKNSDLGLSLY